MRAKSKALATWLALLGGSVGAHRFYLHGRRDVWAWLHPWPTLAGLVGVLRMRALGQDDHLAWLLIPILGLMLSQAMLAAIVIGLTPDERWKARFASDQPGGWPAVIGVVAALMVGGAVLMGTLAFSGQKYFEWQAEQADQH
ncbi:NINE protein [Aquabacterium sp.]|uniref:NINE protein n=1 Tax=Aquabacterium sp. TaxID=1872578 RepID=UPI0037838061